MKKYHLISLGCPKNLVDSEQFASILEHGNYEYTDVPEEAHVVIINTCGFIAPAKEESVDTILEATQLREEGVMEKLIVTGCLVKRYKEDIALQIPEIDYIVDLKDFNKMAEIFSTTADVPRKVMTLPHYAYIRISDGCDNHCSYCAIPGIRGHLISRPMEEIIAEANYLAKGGVKELIVTAQDTAQYGFDLYKEQRLPELMKALHEIEGFEWIRVLYLHPAHITSKIIDTMASLPKICNYFEIPLQHISDPLLTAMNRHVSKARIQEIITELKTKLPNSVFRTTFIVGYPGETDEDFQELKHFVQETRFGRMGVFTYSREEDTPAYEIEAQIDEEVMEARRDELMQMQQDISTEFLEQWIDQTLDVIVDIPSEEEDFNFEGRTYFDAPDIDGNVFIIGENLKPGQIVKVKIIDSWEYDLIGKVVR